MISLCIPLKTTSCILSAHLQKSSEESRLISILPNSVVSYLEKTLIKIGKVNETKKVSKTKINPTVVDLDAISQEIIERN